MKNLDLTQIGVQELSIQEQKKTDGGWFLTALVILAVGWGVFALGNAIGNTFDNKC